MKLVWTWKKKNFQHYRANRFHNIQYKTSNLLKSIKMPFWPQNLSCLSLYSTGQVLNIFHEYLKSIHDFSLFLFFVLVVIKRRMNLWQCILSSHKQVRPSVRHNNRYIFIHFIPSGWIFKILNDRNLICGKKREKKIEIEKRIETLSSMDAWEYSIIICCSNHKTIK